MNYHAYLTWPGTIALSSSFLWQPETPDPWFTQSWNHAIAAASLRLLLSSFFYLIFFLKDPYFVVWPWLFGCPIYQSWGFNVSFELLIKRYHLQSSFLLRPISKLLPLFMELPSFSSSFQQLQLPVWFLYVQDPRSFVHHQINLWHSLCLLLEI